MEKTGLAGLTIGWKSNRDCARKVSAGILLALLCAFLGTGNLKALTVSSTVQEDNGATSNGLDGNQNLYSTPTAGNATITTAGGYTFAGTAYASLTSITSISVTLTVQDGNSEAAQPDGFDYNHLQLSLGGTATGLTLNGFRGDGLEDTLTFTGAPTNAATILASLKANGDLVGVITTNNPNDTILEPNEVYVGNDAGNASTTLSITGAVPEPGTWVGVGLGMLLLAKWRAGKRWQLRRA